MPSNKIKLGFVGGGNDSLIGVLHKVAAVMFDRYEIVGGVFSSNSKINISTANDLGLDLSRVYNNYEEMAEVESKLESNVKIEAVCILTPNFLHFPMAKTFLMNGFHVICEKPLSVTLKEALELKEIKKSKNLVFAVTHTYTGYPMVRQMTKMISDNVIGNIQRVDSTYFQGWINDIIHDKDKRNSTWRLNPEISGISSCLADIGTHAFNMLELVCGMKVKNILADLNNLYDDNPLDIDVSVLVRMENGCKGTIRSTQIATGLENNLNISIYGSKGSLSWEQENPNYLYYYTADKPLQVLKPGHFYNSKLSLDGTKLPAGHPEGIFDAMGNIYRGVAREIRKEKIQKGEFPTIDEGVRGMDFIEKAVESNKKGNIWIDLES
jgi:predicted dehydrogenase